MLTADIRAKAVYFVERHKDDHSEESESQTFWNDFFDIFGVSRRRVATFEKHIENVGKRGESMDLLWPGKLLVEQKSAGKSLNDAMKQANRYISSMQDDEIPRYVLACNFTHFVLHDLEVQQKNEFSLKDLPNNIALFGFMIEKVIKSDKVDPVNQKATQLLGEIYKTLSDSTLSPEHTERFLTRVAFCMFADDAGIFERGKFNEYINKYDSSTVGAKIIELFQKLDDETSSGDTSDFPYINGALFKDRIDIPTIHQPTQILLRKAHEYNWTRINPAIFGGMFQAIMTAESRRNLGAHYTTEDNIMRVIKPLFLDDLYVQFKGIKRHTNNRKLLEEFQHKLAGLTFLDPACGSGNFLSIAYRELRKLEMRVILELHDPQNQKLDVSVLSKVSVSQFYGIEIKSFSAHIAEISMWMTDHLMNRELSERYGQSYVRLPLEHQANIICADALEMDWDDVLPADKCNYILGNPPYSGSRHMSDNKRIAMKKITKKCNAYSGKLDYVTGWFFKAAEYTNANHRINIGFVATNSITQGEQVGLLWPTILNNYGLRIHFAYRTFKWGSEAPGMAHVHVVIVGLTRTNTENRLFYTDHGDTNDKLLEDNPKTISPYLTSSKNPSVVMKASHPLHNLQEITKGSQIYDNGHYTFTDEEKIEFVKNEPKSKPYLRPFISAKNFIDGSKRWILDLYDVEPHIVRKLPHVCKRIDAVRKYRMSSTSPATRKAAEYPQSYFITVIPDSEFLVIPVVSSSRREYVPIGYVKPPTISSNANMIILNATLGLFGLLTSRMHMVWLSYVGGQLKSDYRYSASHVYNTFPVPPSAPKCLKKLNTFAQTVLNVRSKYLNSTLADLYDKNTMPLPLRKAHKKLDSEVEQLYRRKSFDSDDDRMEFLLNEYESMIHNNKA